MKKLSEAVVTNIIDIFTVSSTKGRFEKINNRKSYGLSFCIDGQITYTHNGIEYISDKEHAVILPQKQNYTLYGDKKGIFPVINFQCMDILCDTIIVLPIQNNKSFIKDYEQIKTLFLFNQNRAKIISIFYDMLHRLSSYGITGNTLSPALKYIEKNYQNPNLTNARLAQECKISEIYFRKLFTEQFKITPKQFIIDVRIQKAKQLLSEGSLKINAVSNECGFSNPYHFCRTFKEKTGMTPTEYLKQNKIYKI